MTVIDLTQNVKSNPVVDLTSAQETTETQLELPILTKPTKKRARPLNISNNTKTVEIRNNKLQLNQNEFRIFNYPFFIIRLGKYFDNRNLIQPLQVEPIENWLETNFIGLIGYLAIESTLTINQLATYIKSILCPTQFDTQEDPFHKFISIDFIKSILLKCGHFQDYCIKFKNFEHIKPTNLTITKFELIDCNHFNPDLMQFLNQRSNERYQLLNEAQEMVETLSLQDQLNLIQLGVNSEEFESIKLYYLNQVPIASSETQLSQPVTQSKPIPPTKPDKIQQPKIQGFFKFLNKSNNQSNNSNSEVKLTEKIELTDYERYFLKFRVKNFVKLPTSPNFTIKEDLLDNLNQLDSLNYDQLSKRDKLLSCFPNSSNGFINNNRNESKNKSKLLQFSENYRPPYYGTFNKFSTIITGRRWNQKDEQNLDYEVDSELEWEEEDGEALDSSEGESDDEDEGLGSDASSEQEGDWISDDPDNEDSEDDDDLDTAHVHKPTLKRIKTVTQLVPEVIPPTLFLSTGETKTIGKIIGGYQLNLEDVVLPLDPRGSHLPIKVDTPIVDFSKANGPPVSKWTKDDEKRLTDILDGNIQDMDKLIKYLKKGNRFNKFNETELEEKILQLAEFDIRPQKLTPAWYLK